MNGCMNGLAEGLMSGLMLASESPMAWGAVLLVVVMRLGLIGRKKEE